MYADFQGQNPNPLGSAMAGAEFAQSMYERKHRMKLDEQRMQLAQEQADTLRPVWEAKAKADIATAQAELEGVRQTEASRFNAMNALPAARREFDEAFSLEDPLQRADAMTRWAGKYGHFVNLGPTSSEFDGKTKVAARVIQESLDLHKLNEQVRVQVERAKIAADASRYRSLPALEKIKLFRDEAAAEGDTESVKLYDAMLAKATHIAPTKPDALDMLGRANSRVQEEEALAQEAEVAGDTEAAAFHKRQAESYRGFVSLRTERQVKTSLKEQVLERLRGKPSSSSTQPATPTPSAPAQSVDSALDNLKF